MSPRSAVAETAILPGPAPVVLANNMKILEITSIPCQRGVAPGQDEGGAVGWRLPVGDHQAGVRVIGVSAFLASPSRNAVTQRGNEGLKGIKSCLYGGGHDVTRRNPY